MPRILHLSDLHFRPGDPEDRDSSGRALLATVTDLRGEGAAPELVLVSGDLVEHGDKQAYPVVARFFDRLREAAGDLPRERLLVVPGNHDVDRGRGRRLQRTLSSLSDARLFFEDAEERALHRRKLAGYIDFVDGYFGGGGAEPPAVQLSLGALRVGVGLFCSAWFSQDDDDREQLWIGADGVAAAAIALSDCDLTIALLHHGPEWLHPLERPAALAALGRFDLVCHGHLHGGRPPDHAGTPLEGRLVLAAGALHRRAQRPSRAFLIDADPAGVEIQPLLHRRGAERWEPDETLGGIHGVPLGRGRGREDTRDHEDGHDHEDDHGDGAATEPATEPATAAAPPPRRVAMPVAEDPAALARATRREEKGRDEEARLQHLAALVAAAEAQPAAVRHPAQGQGEGAPILLEQLYLELPARAPGAATADGDEVEGVHGLLREAHLVLVGPPGAGKSATLSHLAGQLARRHLGMPSEAEGWDLGPGPPPLPVPLPLGQVAASRPGPADLLAAIDTEVARARPGTPVGFAGRVLLSGPALLLADGLDEAPPARRPALLQALRDLCRDHPQARLVLGLRPASEALVARALAGGPGNTLRPRVASLVPLRLPERLRLIDRFVQVTSAIPVGMTIFGGAATLDAALRRAAGGAATAALAESPLLLTAMCWVGARFGLPPQRAELFAHCLGALVENRLRPDADGVGALIDEMAETSEALRSFRTAQALEDRPDPWDAVRPQLDEPSSYEALRFLAGLLARRSHELAGRILRAVLSEAGGRRDAGERAQLFALAAQLHGAMVPYEPDEKLGRRAQDELGRLLTDLEDRLQRSPLQTRVAIAEGLGRAGDPRLPLDLLEPGPALWVELPAGGGHRAFAIGRYPLTCAQLWQLVLLSGYEPRAEGPGKPVRDLWRGRAAERPNHPATMISYDDALFVCRFLTQADWRYRYDLPAESEWERAVRQGASDNRFYPWGGSMEPTYCNTGRRVGKTTPVGVFPAGTAAAGAGAVDLVGNVWQWCQSEYDEDPTMMDIGDLGEDGGALEVVAEAERVARGGSYAYLKTGVMRGTFPGTRSEEIGLRLVRRSK